MNFPTVTCLSMLTILELASVGQIKKDYMDKYMLIFEKMTLAMDS